MDPSFLMKWKNLLEESNHGKKEHPFSTPNGFITFPAKLRAIYCVTFRSLEGIARLFARITGTASICCINICCRMKKIVPTINDSHGKPVECAIDSTGLKNAIRGKI